MTKDEVKKFVTKEEMQLELDKSEEIHEKLKGCIYEVKRVQEVHTQKLNALHEDTKELIEAFRALKAINSFLIWLGRVIKPLIVIGTVVTAITLYLKGFPAPPLK